MKIFISSVQREFAKERKEIANLIREDRLFSKFFDEVFLFEETSAKAKSAQKVYLDAVADCDLYLCLVGESYGNAPKGSLSPTECEYDKATEFGKDRLVFVKDSEHREPAERQFLAKISSGVTWHSFSTSTKLVESVYDALFSWLEDNDLVTNKPFDVSTSRKVQLADLDERKFEDYKAMVKEARKVRLASGAQPTDVLRKIQAIDKTNGKIVNGAIPLFAAHPEETRGSWEVCCIQFYGTEQVRPLPAIHTYNGTVFELVDQALDFVLSRADYGVGGLKRGCATEGREELPHDAVREAIVNAVCHRDYASNACVQVMLFRDRLEIINPGCLPKGTTIQDLLIAHDSNPRNHLIARAMSWTNYVEKSGSGTGEIIRLCREAGLADPVFESLTGHFKTIIWRRGYGPNQGSESGARVKGSSQRAPVCTQSRHPVGTQSAPSRGTQSRHPVDTQSRHPVGTQSAPSRGTQSAPSRHPVAHEVDLSIYEYVITLCESPQSTKDLLTAVGRSDRSKFKRFVMRVLMEDGFVAYTIPRKPNSRLQKYRLTAKGRRLAAKLAAGVSPERSEPRQRSLEVCDPRAPRKTKGGGR